MRSTRVGLLIGVLLLGTATWAPGQEHTAPHGTAIGAVATAPHASPDDPAPQPVLPDPSPMPGALIILILGMFLAAAIVGPVVRYHEPEPLPEPSDHDDHGPGSHDHHAHRH